MLTHRTIALRDPATWGVKREGKREFFVRNEVGGREWAVWDWDVRREPGSMVFFLVGGLCAREVDRDGCSCPNYALAVSESGYCEHTACVEAVRRFLAREA